MAMPTKVKIVDLTARDGLEGIKRLIPVDFRVDLINRLTDAGFPAIEVGEFVSPKVIPALQYTDQVNHQITQKPSVEYSALVPNMRGFGDALAAGVKYITIFASATEAFSHANINCSIEQSFERFAPVMVQNATPRSIESSALRHSRSSRSSSATPAVMRICRFAETLRFAMWHGSLRPRGHAKRDVRIGASDAW